ncbi:hypothetical protein ACHAWF_013162 [Thalassiosira exigua]
MTASSASARRPPSTSGISGGAPSEAATMSDPNPDPDRLRERFERHLPKYGGLWRSMAAAERSKRDSKRAAAGGGDGDGGLEASGKGEGEGTGGAEVVGEREKEARDAGGDDDDDDDEAGRRDEATRRSNRPTDFLDALRSGRATSLRVGRDPCGEGCDCADPIVELDVDDDDDGADGGDEEEGNDDDDDGVAAIDDEDASAYDGDGIELEDTDDEEDERRRRQVARRTAPRGGDAAAEAEGEGAVEPARDVGADDRFESDGEDSVVVVSKTPRKKKVFVLDSDSDEESEGESLGEEDSARSVDSDDGADERDSFVEEVEDLEESVVSSPVKTSRSKMRVDDGSDNDVENDEDENENEEDGETLGEEDSQRSKGSSDRANAGDSFVRDEDDGGAGGSKSSASSEEEWVELSSDDEEEVAAPRRVNTVVILSSDEEEESESESESKSDTGGQNDRGKSVFAISDDSDSDAIDDEVVPRRAKGNEPSQGATPASRRTRPTKSSAGGRGKKVRSDPKPKGRSKGRAAKDRRTPDSDEENVAPNPRELPTSAADRKSTVRAFHRNRDALTSRAFREFDLKAFDGALSAVEVSWSKKLNKTAGITRMRGRTTDGVQTRTATIELATKVIDDEERLRETLLHEMCHAAQWLVDGTHKPPHGRCFKKWASIAMRRVRDVEVTTTHDYRIAYKYAWACTSPGCNVVVQRHSRSVDPTRQCCGRCRGRLQEIEVPGSAGDGRGGTGGHTAKKQRKASGFALFVQTQSASVRKALAAGRGCPTGEVSQADVMKECGVRWRERKGESAREGIEESDVVGEKDGLESLADRLVDMTLGGRASP